MEAASQFERGCVLSERVGLLHCKCVAIISINKWARIGAHLSSNYELAWRDSRWGEIRSAFGQLNPPPLSLDHKPASSAMGLDCAPGCRRPNEGANLVECVLIDFASQLGPAACSRQQAPRAPAKELHTHAGQVPTNRPTRRTCGGRRFPVLAPSSGSLLAHPVCDKWARFAPWPAQRRSSGEGAQFV